MGENGLQKKVCAQSRQRTRWMSRKLSNSRPGEFWRDRRVRCEPQAGHSTIIAPDSVAARGQKACEASPCADKGLGAAHIGGFVFVEGLVQPLPDRIGAPDGEPLDLPDAQ